jgi:hypothetical protein
MKTIDLIIPFQERPMPDTRLREVANIPRDDERSGVKGGVTP